MAYRLGAQQGLFRPAKSLDGRTWQSFGLVRGAGQSVKQVDYEALDESPYTGRSYYRLMQVDYDGSFAYSEVVTVDMGERTAIRLFPNPTTAANVQVSIEVLQTGD